MHVNELYPRWLVCNAGVGGRQCFILDVRTPAEYADAHIPGARSIPLGSIPARLEELPSGVDIHLICRSGARSKEVAGILAACGFSRLLDIQGGMLAWIAMGYPVQPVAQQAHDRAA